MDYSLSNYDIQNLLNNKCNLVSYSDIKNYKTLNQLLGKYKKCVILYKSANNYGHWTCIYEHKGIIYFFDSYGFVPNAQLKFLPNHLNKELEQDHKHLIKLILDTQKPVEFNEFPLQEFKKGINTCGKWVVFRLKHPSVPIKMFNDLFKNKSYTPDELINKLVKI